MDQAVITSHIIIKNIETLLLENDLVDYTVRVEDREFGCHRVILAASSHFFRALLRSNMKEEKEGCVTLSGMSASTFQIILKSLYTGKVVLTLDNFIEVWQAADQLQVDFLKSECEKFALKVVSVDNLLTIWKQTGPLQRDFIQEHCENIVGNISLSLDNFEDIWEISKCIRSITLEKACKSFMLKHFDEVRKMKMIMELQINELHELIESRDLVVRTEDLVLETVLKWVEFVPEEAINLEICFNDERLAISTAMVHSENVIEEANEKLNRDIFLKENDVLIIDNANKNRIEENLDKQNTMASSSVHVARTATKENHLKRKGCIQALLKAVRMCLVSAPRLKYSMKHHLIKDNNDLKDIIFEAVLNKTAHYNSGQWRTSSLQRAESEFEHCGIILGLNGFFEIITAFDERLCTCANNDKLRLDVTLVVFDSKIYATGALDESQTDSVLYVLNGEIWDTITDIPGRQLILVSYENCIFVLDKVKAKVYQIFPKHTNPKVHEFTNLSEVKELQQAICYQKCILLFASEMRYDFFVTAVYQLDLVSKICTKIKNIHGPANSIISFSDDNNTFLLQTKGTLYVLQDSNNTVTFKEIPRLLNRHTQLYGALTYRQKLIIFGQDRQNATSKNITSSQTDAFFSEIRFYGRKRPRSNFIPVVLAKRMIKPP